MNEITNVSAPRWQVRDALTALGCEDGSVSYDLVEPKVVVKAVYQGREYTASAKGYRPPDGILWCLASIRKMILRTQDWRDIHGWRGEDG